MALEVRLTIGFKEIKPITEIMSCLIKEWNQSLLKPLFEIL